MFKIGFRAHDFGRFSSFEELGTTIRGYAEESLIQLAPRKVVPSFRQAVQMTSDDAAYIRDSLAANGVSIAVIGSYINPVHPDPDEREKQIAGFARLLELSSALGCNIVATETGSANPDCSFSEETRKEKYFSMLCLTVETLLTTAEAHGAIVALEAVAGKHTIDSSEKMARLLDVFRSEHFKVILDPVNLIPPEGLPHVDDAVSMKETTEKFIDAIVAPVGRDVVALHAKNYIVVDGRKKGDQPLLEGIFDWETAIPALRKNGIDDIPFLLENMDPGTLRDTMSYLSPLL